MPQVLLKGRFWAEEGAVYFINGRNLTWADALFAVHTGYLNLAASIATLLAARVVPLQWAPWISTSFALLIQLCPPLLLLTSGVPWLMNRSAMVLALLMLLATPRSGEVWLNAITSQFHLSLCAALILALSLRRGYVGRFRVALLVLASLSGPVATLLAPLFILRAYFERSWFRMVQGVILGIGGALQLAMILLHPEPARQIGISPRLLAIVIYEKNILLPFLGTAATERLAPHLTADVVAGKTLWAPLLICGGCVVAIVWAAWRSRNTEVRWLLSAGVVMMSASYFAALGQHVELLNVTFGDRYGYAPSALFGLALLGIARTIGGWPRGIAVILLCWVIWIGTHEYFVPGSAFADGSSWRTEVAKWQADPLYQVRWWPDLDTWRWWMLPVPASTKP